MAKKYKMEKEKRQEKGEKERKERKRIKHLFSRNKFLVTALHRLNLNAISTQRQYKHFALLSKTRRQLFCGSFDVKATRLNDLTPFSP